MTLKEQIVDDVGDVFLDTDDFAEQVTRYPSGDTGSGVAVTAIWFESSQSRDRSAGDETDRSGELSIASSVTVTITDTWLIASEVWQTKTIGFIDGGMRVLTLTRQDKRTTSRPERRQYS